MKVLIVGPTYYQGLESSRDLFVTAFRQLGAALAEAGFKSVVSSDDPNAADR